MSFIDVVVFKLRLMIRWLLLSLWIDFISTSINLNKITVLTEKKIGAGQTGCLHIEECK